MLRFLSLCPRGQRFYKDNTDAITKYGLTELEAITLYKKFAPKLERHETANSVTVKEEPSSTFLNEQPERPAWSKEMTEDIRHGIQATMSFRAGGDSDSSESDLDNVLYANKPSVSRRSSTGSKKNDMTSCRSCSKSGHYQADCFVKCISCGGKGHNSKVCPSKVFKKNTKRPSIKFSAGPVKEVDVLFDSRSSSSLVSYEMIPSSLKPTLRPASVVNGIGETGNLLVSRL